MNTVGTWHWLVTESFSKDLGDRVMNTVGSASSLTLVTASRKTLVIPIIKERSHA